MSDNPDDEVNELVCIDENGVKGDARRRDAIFNGVSEEAERRILMFSRKIMLRLRLQ